MGIKSLLLHGQSGRMSPGALPPFSSRGFYGFCFFLMILRAERSTSKRRCVIMANLLRCYRHSGLVMYFSTLPAPSASAPCILAILTHLRVRVKICILTHPPLCLVAPGRMVEGGGGKREYLEHRWVQSSGYFVKN